MLACRPGIRCSPGRSFCGNMQGSTGPMPDPHQPPVRILIVDDHPVVLAGLTSMLGTQRGIEVVGAASSGDEALEMLRARSVDLVLLDLRMPGMNGVDTL